MYYVVDMVLGPVGTEVTGPVTLAWVLGDCPWGAVVASVLRGLGWAGGSWREASTHLIGEAPGC